MQDGENEGKKAQETDNPRQERPHARHFAEENGRDLDKSCLNARHEFAIGRQANSRIIACFAMWPMLESNH